MLRLLLFFVASSAVRAHDDDKAHDHAQDYVLVDTEKTWEDAKAHCVSEGMQLAVIKSSAENVAAAKAANGEAWIGLHDIREENRWEWIDGSAMGYSNWADGQPDDWKGAEDCAHIMPDGTWNDSHCGGLEKLTFVCQKCSAGCKKAGDGKGGDGKGGGQGDGTGGGKGGASDLDANKANDTPSTGTTVRLAGAAGALCLAPAVTLTLI